jgi:hypothetical protein
VLAAAGPQHDLHLDDREPGGLNLGRDGAQQVLETTVKRSAPVMLGRLLCLLGLLDRVLSAQRSRIGV